MRINDVYVIMPYDYNEDITDMDILERSNISSNVSLSSLNKEDFASEYILETLGKYIDGFAGAFTFKKDYKNIVFKELYSKFKEECERLTFEDFCNPFYLSTVSSSSPIIVYCDDLVGITVNVLEDFLRMSDLIEQTTFKVVALYSRHV